MALVTVSGYPCSGKSTRVAELVRILQEQQALEVVIISDESIHISRDAYDESRSEKPARAALLSAVVRALRKDRIVICDAMNYIKSLRYQYYCAAREAGCRTCTLNVVAPINRCRAWNIAKGDKGYLQATFDNLLQRYEEPSYATRWDTPLIVVSDEDACLPVDKIMSALTTATLKPPTGAVLPTSVPSGDYLHLLETVTQSVITAIIEAQAIDLSGGSTKLHVNLSHGQQTLLEVNLPSIKVPPSKMHRLKRQFTILNRQSRKDCSAETIASMFADYLASNLL
ncbi:uncharacterized protein L969DRAFT_84343 [Mixia osmundae IAM 14324]|uniref:Chromatin associated protein KTI12 n=1 Tax=Mixia osmundae (strain CBS 9802 / IAM 14324 / JCM 22182 / KY 12970) TaxID=764103 RepID=G7E346_MIXOS|nr:uncharacterized protein L969DRAFT_84343 [Mixia osmundae IAM 14324]KEI42488.1 hypothetical protein L969DRAFT_84343 [Mixia osmundae IAM 14324]GAA97227.1 hypothetical protein E5Q_03903 [Mixia osmundae IAM 14324]